ncbi:DUF1707 and FHA domain-containing protein [Streptomyces sp. NPDC001941]|uniref:DUF1707 and FHA domain-containing protein n=1 Tax=Streptomyces sp. NPDC001941 TaxID=3154659 RepID=UPI00332D5B87
MTSSYEPHTYPARLTDAQRDRVLDVLRDGVAQGRLSQDTFVRRMELALVARHPDQLLALTADLREDGRWTRRLYGAVERASAFTAGLGRAWRAERLPKLLLPEPGPYPLRIGRDPFNGLRLSHETVSRRHAELSLQGDLWVLRDLGSTNGTTVNGHRVTGAVPVRSGDLVAFGRMGFRLASR